MFENTTLLILRGRIKWIGHTVTSICQFGEHEGAPNKREIGSGVHVTVAMGPTTS